MEKRYIISDASKLIDVESHVLRYWETELDIEIPRNEMGHRYYTDYYIALFKKIKELKDNGFQLKAIKMILPTLLESTDADTTELVISNAGITNNVGLTTDQSGKKNNSEKLMQFKEMLGNIVAGAIKDSNSAVIEAIEENGRQNSESVIKQMDYLLRIKEEAEEDRFRKFDEIMRNYQISGKEAAVGREKKWKKERKLGKKR